MAEGRGWDVFTWLAKADMEAREDYRGVMIELGHVFDEVGSEDFFWEGKEEQKEGKSSMAKVNLHHGGGRELRGGEGVRVFFQVAFLTNLR